MQANAEAARYKFNNYTIKCILKFFDIKIEYQNLLNKRYRMYCRLLHVPVEISTLSDMADQSVQF